MAVRIGADSAIRRTEQLRADEEGHDHRGRAEADGQELVHGGDPPRADEGPLSFLFDLGTHRVVDLVLQLLLAFQEEVVDQPVGISGRGHAIRSWEGGVARASASMLARSALVAWCKRDFAVPTGIPVRAATSEIDSPR